MIKIQNSKFKNLAKRLKSSQGSAMVVAVITVSVLMTISLGINAFTQQNILFSKNKFLAEKNFFTAEAGVELALLDIKENPPGFEIEKKIFTDDEESLYKIESATDIFYNFSGGDLGSCNDLKNSYSISGDDSWKKKAYKIEPTSRVVIPFFSASGGTATNFKIWYFLEEGQLGIKFLAKKTISSDIPVDSINQLYVGDANKWLTINEQEAADFWESEGMVFVDTKTFQSFLEDPKITEPYLIVTNLSNKKAYFCIDSLDKKISKLEVTIKSDAVAGGALRSIDMQVPLGKVLPHFMFAIHHK